MSSRIALSGVVLGLTTLAYVGLVLLPGLSVPGGLEANFPSCPNTNKFYRFTTQGAVDYVDRLLCIILSFFSDATAGTFATWNWAEFLITMVPVSIHALEASTTAKRGFWVLLIPFVVFALGQAMGAGVTVPLFGLPIYALSSAAQAAPRETSVPVAWAIVITSLLFLLPNALFFIFPNASELWVYTTIAFQLSVPCMYLAPLPVAMCCRNPGDHRRSRAHGHALLLFLYGIALGACLLGHMTMSLRLAQQSNWSLNVFFTLFNEAWMNMKVRFLMVDHGSAVLAVFLMVILDGGFGGLFLVLSLAPFLSIGGAVCYFYARPHIAWMLDLKKEKNTKRE